NSHNGDRRVDVGNCNGVCHLVFDRRARSCPRERRGKLMLARRETTLQKTEMPKQTRYNSRSSSAGDFEILFFIKFYNNAEFCFTFF
uniref:Uncharacterized protein n=1 Tax=Anas platyrhynchos platyrhynchos TaxID=8840 RepID=A0A493TAT3_ANAPP